MAEIILPPEENEEIPQTPELNIDKPTENSKVITIEFEAKKTKKVSTKDTKQQLYTTDTDAWFEFKETSLEGGNGTYSVVFKNRHDGSIFQRTGDVVGGVAYYKIPHQEIRHAGAWRGQVVYTLSNGDTTAREFDYDVKGHILDGKDVREIVVEDFETLMSQLRSMKDNAEVELASLTQELRSTTDTAEQNETDRQSFFDDLVEDIDELQTNYQELLDTGVLQTNINNKLEALEEEYAPKLTEVTAQLAEKATKGEITRHDMSVASDNHKLTLNNVNEEFRSAIRGEAPVSNDIEDGSLTKEKYAPSSLTPTKMRASKRVGNLFDRSEVEVGYYISPSDGTKHEGTSVGGLNVLSDMINVSNIDTVSRSEHYCNILSYNSERNYIGGVNNEDIVETDSVIKLPTNTHYIIVGVRESNLNDIVIVEGGNVPTEYIPSKYILDWFEQKGTLPYPLYEVGKVGNSVSINSVGDYLFNYNVNGRVLTSDNIISVTDYSNTTVAFTNDFAPDIYIMGSEESDSDGVGTISIPDRHQFESYTGRNYTNNIGNYYRTHDGQLRFVMEKGTTLTQAKEELSDTLVKYQVRNPRVIEFKPDGNALDLIYNSSKQKEKTPVISDRVKEDNQLLKTKLNSAGVFRIGTFNIRYVDTSINKANEIITKSGVNVLGAQEIKHGGAFDFFDNYTNWNMLDGKFNRNLINHWGDGRDYGNAFLSDYKILESQEAQFDMNGTGLEQRGYLRNVVLINGKRTSIYTTHYSPFITEIDLNQRNSEMQQTIDLMINDENDYVVLVGDFNHEDMNEMDIFTNKGYKLANDGSFITSDTGYPKDGVIVSPNIDIIDVGMLPHEGSSDHALFWADVVLN